MSIEEIEKRYLRIHMLHRHLEIEERYLLHPRILDVLEALIGPGVMAMRRCTSSRRRVAPGRATTRTAYIPTYPDTLCGAWIAVDRADEENGCLWVTTGSQHEPIYPTEERVRQNHTNLGDLVVVENVSNMDTELNTLSRIAAKYPGREVPAIAEPGDVVFFGGHVLHRSHTNMSKDRFRRALVCHYGNAAPSPCGAPPTVVSRPTTCTSLAVLDAAVRSAPLRHALLPTNLAQPPTAPGWT